MSLRKSASCKRILAVRPLSVWGPEHVIDNQPPPTDSAIGYRKIARTLGLEGLDRRELEQPLVFFRVGWEFRWLSRSAILSRLLGRADDSTSINSIRDFDSPAELDAFCRHVHEFVSGSDHGIGEGARGQQQFVERALGAARAVVVLPGGWHRIDTQAAFRLGVVLASAFVLPPEEGAWPWAVTWSRPSLIVAGGDQLGALVAELSGMRPRRRRSALAKLRAIVPVSDGSAVSAETIETLEQVCAWAPNSVEVAEPIKQRLAT